MPFKRFLKKSLENITRSKITRVKNEFMLIELSKKPSIKILYEKIYGIELRSVLEFFDINCVIDVGANTGQFAKFLRSDINGNSELILSFEPIKSVFTELKNNAATDQKWEAYNYALGSKDHKQDLNVSKSSDFSSFYNSNDYSKQRFGSKSLSKKKESVSVIRLDDFLELHEDLDLSKTSILLKMDTQGHDIEVFKGAQKILNRVHIIQSEISIIPIYDKTPSYTESLNIFEDEGFKIASMCPVNFDQNKKCIIEYDCLMVKV